MERLPKLWINGMKVARFVAAMTCQRWAVTVYQHPFRVDNNIKSILSASLKRIFKVKCAISKLLFVNVKLIYFSSFWNPATQIICCSREFNTLILAIWMITEKHANSTVKSIVTIKLQIFSAISFHSKATYKVQILKWLSSKRVLSE